MVWTAVYCRSIGSSAPPACRRRAARSAQPEMPMRVAGRGLSAMDAFVLGDRSSSGQSVDCRTIPRLLCTVRLIRAEREALPE